MGLMKNRLAPVTLFFAASLASCSYFNEQERTVKMMAPAPLPAYAAGDTYVFDDDGNTVAETVASVTLDGTHWTSDSGVYWTSYANPFLQPKEYAANDGALKIERTHSNGGNEFFPLKVGKRAKYSVTERTLGSEAAGVHNGECEVISQQNVTVRAGTFYTYEVACERMDGSKTFFYAPKVRHNVLTTSGNLFFRKSKELISFNKGAPKKDIEEKPEAAKKSAPSPKSPKSSKSSNTKEAMLKRFDARRKAHKIKSKTRNAPPRKRIMYGVQLGAFFSHASAKAAWRRFAKENPERLANVNARYQEYLPPDGRKMVIRLVVGEFNRFKDANLFCDGVKESGLDCWSVKLN